MIRKSKWKETYNDEKIFAIEARICNDRSDRKDTPQWFVWKKFKTISACLDSLRDSKNNWYATKREVTTGTPTDMKRYMSWWEFRPIHYYYSDNYPYNF